MGPDQSIGLAALNSIVRFAGCGPFDSFETTSKKGCAESPQHLEHRHGFFSIHLIAASLHAFTAQFRYSFGGIEAFLMNFSDCVLPRIPNDPPTFYTDRLTVLTVIGSSTRGQSGVAGLFASARWDPIIDRGFSPAKFETMAGKKARHDLSGRRVLLR